VGRAPVGVDRADVGGAVCGILEELRQIVPVQLAVTEDYPDAPFPTGDSNSLLH
jgi:hypothetical protein